jgi:putative hydrolase of the HAD superfamily
MADPIHVVFDLDDTLYPERAFAIGGFKAAGSWAQQRWGVEGIAENMQTMLDTGHLGGLFKATLEKFVPECTPEDVAAFVDVYRNHDPMLELYPDALSALNECASLGNLGLITDGTDWVQARKVQGLGIEPRFRKIIYTFALGGREFHKPNPKAFEVMAAALRASSRETRLVYVGDNPSKDFVAPNAMGWTTVQILREQTIHDTRVAPVSGGAPQHVLSSLTELRSILLVNI